MRRPDPDRGGISLTDQQTAVIRERWRANLRQAVHETDVRERKRLMSVAVAGAGISGIETSAELALEMQKEALYLDFIRPKSLSI